MFCVTRSQLPLEPQHCPAELCLLCLAQVQLAFTTFFKEHKFIHVTGADIPSIHFTNEFVGFLKTEECDAGYGQTKQLQRCLDCCSKLSPQRFGPLLFFPLMHLTPSPSAVLCLWVLAFVPMHTQPRECSGLGSSESLSTRTQLSRLFVEYTLNKQHVPLLRKAFLHVLSSVTCPPGMFSPPKNRQCFLCPVGTYSLTYGAVSCTRCKDGTTTKDPGANSMLFCVKEEMTKQGTQICY